MQIRFRPQVERLETRATPSVASAITPIEMHNAAALSQYQTTLLPQLQSGAFVKDAGLRQSTLVQLDATTTQLITDFKALVQLSATINQLQILENARADIVPKLTAKFGAGDASITITNASIDAMETPLLAQAGLPATLPPSAATLKQAADELMKAADAAANLVLAFPITKGAVVGIGQGLEGAAKSKPG